MSHLQYVWQAIPLSPTRKGLLIAISLTTALLTAGYLLGNLVVETPVVFLAGLLWLVCVLRDLRWVASPLFLLLLSAIAIGYVANLSHLIMLAAGCTNLLAWDLHHFESRILDVNDPDTREMEKNHLMRLGIVIAATFLLITVDSLLQIRFQFFILVLVTIVVIFILNHVMLSIRKSGKPPKPKP